MANRRAGKTRVRHNPRKWTLQALQSAGDGAAMPTSAIIARASKLSGSKIPYYSVYQALRTLVRNRRLAAQRKGRELVYRLVTSAKVGRPRGPSRVAVITKAPVVVRESVSLTATGLHKIAPGEIALLHVSESHVETAANIDGKLVLKRHPRPN
ncbi:MAG: hypothetical protein L3J93_00310 [Thermoplasmata archaeon]|nr:hypothetical protein [Thermoplasmata archaeon]